MASLKPGSRSSLVVLLAIGLLLLFRQGGFSVDSPNHGAAPDTDIEGLIQAHATRTWVETGGSVSRVLSDDKEGAAHQRFILRLNSGHTVLVAHNIDLARRVPLRIGDELRLRGRYEWNDKGGVIHWTHHDPDRQTAGGWIEYKAIRYE